MNGLLISGILFSILLVICIGLIILFIIGRKYWSQTIPHLTKCSIKEYAFKTGDLILTSTKKEKNARAIFGTITNIFTNSFFNHAAIVYVDQETKRVYVWDVVASGPRLIPMDEFISEGFQIPFIRSINKHVDTSTFEKVMNQQWTSEFNFDIGSSWYHRYIPSVPFLKGYNWSKQSSKICASSVAEMYHQLSVLNFENWGKPMDTVFSGDLQIEISSFYQWI